MSQKQKQELIPCVSEGRVWVSRDGKRFVVPRGERFDALQSEIDTYPKYLIPVTEPEEPEPEEEEEGKEPEGDDGDDEDSEFPRHVGGRYWDLSDGTRFQGSRKEAEKAEAALS